MRILMIEDDLAYAKSIQLTLKTEGLEVEIAEGGEDGLDLGSIYEYSAILLDLGLPDISGQQVLRRLRKKMADMSDGENYIETVWGRGYILRDPATAEPKKPKAAK